ncbi:MAG: hypothetical protein ACFBZ8_12720 [Opitutales bacterium]
MTRFIKALRPFLRRRSLRPDSLLLATAILSPAMPAAHAQGVALTIGDAPQHALDPRLFGQFLEKASWGEPGPEAVLPEGQQELPENVLEHLEAMQIPLIRFPGGSDIKVLDWTDWISNAPNRENPERPVSLGMRGDQIGNRFGLDEYFLLRDRLGCETMLVVNLHDALYKEKTIEEAARHAAGMVAYCNARQGEIDTDTMPDWPAIRAQNGHSEPFNAEFFQIGNETFFFWPPKPAKAKELGLTTLEAQAEHYIQCVVAIADAMRAVDSSIQLVLDGPRQASHDEDASRRALFFQVVADPRVRERFEYLAYHSYAATGSPYVQAYARPEKGPVESYDDAGWWSFRLSGQVYKQDAVEASALWYTWTARPGYIGLQGLNQGIGPIADFARGLGYKVACTEWNFNHWSLPKREDGLQFEWAGALGCAGYLHGMIRQGDVIKLGAQSMLLGVSWGIAALYYDADHDPQVRLNSRGWITGFYARHAGTEVVPITYESTARVALDTRYPDGWGWPEGASLAVVDAVATQDETHLILHLINRHFDEAQSLTITLPEAVAETLPATAWHHLVTGDIKKSFRNGLAHEETTHELSLTENPIQLTLPPRSLSAIKIPLPGEA